MRGDILMISIKNLTKRYKKNTALSDLSFNIDENGIYCLVGRNGAGKTTLMKIIAGQILDYKGSVLIDNKNISKMSKHNYVNFIESNGDYFDLPILDLIDSANLLQDNFDRSFALMMADKLELKLDKKYYQLSLGMKIMVTTILNLANKSEIVLLDEPTLGFDPMMRNQFYNLLQDSLIKYPRIIIISTHMIDEIANVANELIIIDKGQLVLKTDLDNIDEKAYTITGESTTVLPLLETLNCIGKTVVGSKVTAQIYDDRTTIPNHVRIDRLSVQDFFIHMIENGRSIHD